jgi:uncharacterized protein YjbI with pentapeptide repeats
VIESRAVTRGVKEPRSSRFSTLGIWLSIAIAGVVALLAWYVIARSALPTGAGSGNSSSAAVPIASCSFPAAIWKDSTGQDRPAADLKEIEARHQLWVSSKHQQGEQADFSPRESQTNLSCIDMRRFQLQEADFEGAILSGANLRGADLTGATFSSVVLENPMPESSDLGDTKLPGTASEKAESATESRPTILTHTILQGAHLHHTDFTGAFLMQADLTGADLDGETDLTGAHLQGVIFEPMNLPGTELTYTVEGLSGLRYNKDPRPLSLLRSGFHDDGYTEQERQIIYALQHTKASNEWKECLLGHDNSQPPRLLSVSKVAENCMAASLNELVFGWTFQYGMNPIRPLYIIGALWLLCSILYVVIIKTRRRSAIFLVCRRQCRDGTIIIRRRRIIAKPLKAAAPFERFWRTARREIEIWRLALFFSLMSALNIGIQELHFGKWLKLLTTREYELEAGRWARTLSGAQALLSVLMLALSIWALFGQPFSS